VPEFCTCGAKLPEDALFCHKCGKPQRDYLPRVEFEEAPPPLPAPAVQAAPEISFHNRLAVRIGFFVALVAVLPFMVLLPIPLVPSAIAFFTGFLAVFSYCRLSGESLSIRSGARMGWITGIFSFTIITFLITTMVVAVVTQGKFGEVLHQYQQQAHLTDEQLSLLTKLLADPAGMVAGVAATLVTLFIMLTGFPMLGGALGAKVLTKG